MYYSESNCASFTSSENSEVFRKEVLETKGKDSMDEKRGKQKRRDRVSKTKTHSSKSKHVKTGGDVLAQIKAKENIVAPNNSTQRITVSMSKDSGPALFTQRVGIYNKGKSSLMVSRRRPLHDIQVPQKIIHKTEKDLKRVLGYSEDEKSPIKSSPHGKNSPMATGGRQTEERKQSSSEMELSPPPEKLAVASTDGGSDSVLCIARRIAGGLHPCMVYSDTDYLNNVKAELRKLLKQGSGSQSCAQSTVQPDMDTLADHTNDPATDGVFLLPPTTETTSSDMFFSLPLFEEQGKGNQSSCAGSYDFRLDVLRSAIFEPASAASHAETGQPFDLTEVELTTSTHDPSFPTGPPSVEGASAAFQMEPLSPPHAMADPPRDFLDLLDTMQQGGIGEHPNSLSRPPGSKWMPTPERPPMFPQKLY